jgi:hypothetical protein
MNIHLLRSPELNKETYRNVVYLLQQFQGPIHFIASEENLSDISSEEENKLWESTENTEKSNNPSSINFEKNTSISEFKIPNILKTKTWEQLFAECDNFRQVNSIPKEDIVVLLTNISNDINWFGGVSFSMKNYFIHTSNWEQYFGNDIDIRFPIAYEVIVWVMRYYMFANNQEIWIGVHEEAIGCIMDFCEEKKQIILKMRTADVCESCMNKLIERDVPVLYTRQFFEILDGIRQSTTFKSRSLILKQPSKLEIRGRIKKILFKDLGDLELSLNPKEKTLYLLLLRHEKGIKLSHLQDYKDELIKIYELISNKSETEQQKQSINVLIDPLENDANVIISRINRKIKSAVGESLYNFYCIQGERGMEKRIKLDREMVIGLNESTNY